MGSPGVDVGFEVRNQNNIGVQSPSAGENGSPEGVKLGQFLQVLSDAALDLGLPPTDPHWLSQWASEQPGWLGELGRSAFVEAPPSFLGSHPDQDITHSCLRSLALCEWDSVTYTSLGSCDRRTFGYCLSTVRSGCGLRPHVPTSVLRALSWSLYKGRRVPAGYDEAPQNPNPGEITNIDIPKGT